MTDQRCPICHREDLVTETERRHAMCSACAATVVARAVPDPRPRVPCRGCGHTRLVRTTLVDETDVAYKEAGVTVGEPRVERSSWSGQVTEIRPGFGARAPLVAYVCRGCGLTELYTAGFADLPVGPQYGADEIDVAPLSTGGPFR